MISELYNALTAALKTVTEPDSCTCGCAGGEGLIKHIDLWNRNVEFIEEDAPWARPAVFIEFGEVQWRLYGGAKCGLIGEMPVTLHVVTDWKGPTAEGELTSSESVASMDLSELICAKLQGLCGEHFRNLSLLSSQPNHDHEEIVESIERYACKIERRV